MNFKVWPSPHDNDKRELFTNSSIFLALVFMDLSSFLCAYFNYLYLLSSSHLAGGGGGVKCIQKNVCYFVDTVPMVQY